MEKLNIGINLTIVGMGTVFLILLLLQLTMNIETWLFSKWQPSPQKANTPPQETNTKTKKPISDPTITPELIAAITAAIATKTGKPVEELRLVQVRQAHDIKAASSWLLAGRTNQILTRSNFYTKGGRR